MSDVVTIAYEKGYRANDDGSITGIYVGNIKLGKGTNGYLLFRIRDGASFKTVPAHRFAAYCFFGDEIFNHECVRHIDGDKTNNRRSNLTLGSRSDNFQDNSEEWKTNFSMAGAKTKRKLDEEAVKEIRQLLNVGVSYRTLSEKFSVSKGTIQQIKEGKSYRWVD